MKENIWFLVFWVRLTSLRMMFSKGSNILLCWQRLSRLVTKGWAPRTKRSHLIYLCKQVTEEKAKLNPYMAACDFIGYFIPPVLCDLLHVSILKVLSLCFAIPSPFLIIRTHPVCFSSGPPCHIIPTLMLGPTYSQRASSWFRDLCFHSIITCVAIFLFIVASITVLIDTIPWEQGRILLSMPLEWDPMPCFLW
jgi:hypothetical protein